MLGKLKLKLSILLLRKKRAQYRKAPVTGERCRLDGKVKDPIDYLLYRPKTDRKDLPLFVELHGGAWVANDAVLMDSFCRKIADQTPAVVVNLNYKKLDVHPFPYPMEELCHVVSHFISQAETDGIDPSKVVICGQSAGAHISAGAAVMAKDQNIALRHQILVYPFVDFTDSLSKPLHETEKIAKDYVKKVKGVFFSKITPDHPYVSPLVADNETLKGIASATIVICGKDPLRPHGIAYDEKLRQAGVASEVIDYPLAEHGFLEVNRPDYTDPHPGKSPEQAAFLLDCEERIIGILRSL